jgi:hypothetical protein
VINFCALLHVLCRASSCKGYWAGERARISHPPTHLQGAVEAITGDGGVGAELPFAVDQQVQGQCQEPEPSDKPADGPAVHRGCMHGDGGNAEENR